MKGGRRHENEMGTWARNTPVFKGLPLYTSLDSTLCMSREGSAYPHGLRALLGCVKNALQLAACEFHFKREQTFSAAMFPTVIVIAPLDTVLLISGWSPQSRTESLRV